MGADKKKYSYDEECEKLAKYFLADEMDQIREEHRDEVICDLSQELQQVVEDFIMVERAGGRWKQEPEVGK